MIDRPDSPGDRFAQPPIGPARVPETVVIDMYEHVEVAEGGCPENCASCGWESSKGSSDQEICPPGMLKPGSLKEVKEQEMKDMLNRIVAETGVRVRDLLAPFIVTNVNFEPLWTRGAARLARILADFTEKRSPFAPKEFRDLERSRLVLISHGLSLKQDVDKKWVPQGRQEENLIELVELMKEGTIPLFVLSLDVARKMAKFGIEDLAKDLCRMKEKKERISKKIKLMNQLKAALDELGTIPEEDKEAKKAQIRGMLAEFEKCEIADIVAHADFIETADEEIGKITDRISKLKEREEQEKEAKKGEEEGENRKEEPESKLSKTIRTLENRRSILHNKTNKADRAKRITEKELEGVKQESSRCLGEGPISTEFLTDRLSKMDAAATENNDKIEKMPEEISRAVEEANAQGYARTLYLLKPAIEAGARVTVSLQGDKNDNRTNDVRMGRAIKTFNRALELLKEMLERDYPGQGAAKFVALRSMLKQNERFYGGVGRAAGILGITEERPCDIIPDPKFVEYAERLTPIKFNRGKITKGQILVQPKRLGRTYHETVKKDPEAWTPIDLGTRESLKAIADQKMASYRRLAKPRIIDIVSPKAPEDDNENFELMGVTEFVDSDRLFNIWPLNKINHKDKEEEKIQKERVRYALKYLIWEIDGKDMKISSAEEIRKLLIQILVRPEIAEAYRLEGETFNAARRRIAEEIRMYFKPIPQSENPEYVAPVERSASILAVRTLLAEELKIGGIKLPGDYSEEDDDLGIPEDDPTDLYIHGKQVIKPTTPGKSE